jgi:hypothetical protein
MTDSQFLIKKALQLSIEGDRLFKESKTQGTERQKNILTVKACCFWTRADELYDRAQEV